MIFYAPRKAAEKKKLEATAEEWKRDIWIILGTCHRRTQL
jgi:hypothetical protein